jgi:hypothetical protein
MVNSFHATFDRRRDNRAGPSNLPSPKDLGVNMFINTPNFTHLTVSGYSGGGFAIGCGSCALANFDINTYQMADDFSIIKGKHQIGFGFDGRKDQFNSYNNQQSNGHVHLQWQYHRRRPGGPADRPFFGLDGWERDFRLPAPDGDGGLRAGCHPRHVALQRQHWRALGALRAGIRQVRARQPVQLAPVLRRAGTARLIPTRRRAWSSRRIRRRILTAKRSRHPIGPLSRPGWAWFGIRKATASRPFARRSITITIPPMLFYPERWTTNAPYVSSITLSSGQFSNPFAAYTLNGKTGDPFPGQRVFPTQGTYVSIPGNMPVTVRDDVEPQLPTADCHQLGDQSELHG